MMSNFEESGKNKHSNPVSLSANKNKSYESYDEYNYKYCNYDAYDEEMAKDVQKRNMLHWNYRNLREIPLEVLEFGEHIEEIYLKMNALVKLPPEIGKLKNLTNLYLVGNQLTSLPDEMDQLRSLKVLDVSQNFLERLSGSIGKLHGLEELYVSQNQIETLPPELFELSRLRYLGLSGNRIRALDEETIRGFVILEEFCIDRNPILLLPRSLSFLTRLRCVSACSCDLEWLPAVPFPTFAAAYLHRNFPSAPMRYREQFRFDGNPRLYHVPVWLSQFYTMQSMQADSFGHCCGDDDCGICSISCSDSVNCSRPRPQNTIEVPYKGKFYRLKLDEHIQKIYRPALKIPSSLLELCLRKCFKQVHGQQSTVEVIARSRLNIKQFLPVNLARYILSGPSAECFICKQNMFTQVWALVFSLPSVNSERRGANLCLSTVLICGSNCANFFQSTAEKISDYDSILQNEVTW